MRVRSLLPTLPSIASNSKSTQKRGKGVRETNAPSMVATGLKLPGSPCIRTSVTVPSVVGVQVMSNDSPAAMPWKSVFVKGFGRLEPPVWAAATTARAPATRAEMKRMVSCVLGFVWLDGWLHNGMKELSE